jgi:hypothetical protein
MFEEKREAVMAMEAAVLPLMSKAEAGPSRFASRRLNQMVRTRWRLWRKKRLYFH